LERERHRRRPVSLAYHGNKYKTDELVPAIFSTEAGIYEAFIMSDRAMTDHDVRRTLEGLIQELRGGAAPVPPEREPGQPLVGTSPESLTVANIRRHWLEYSGKSPFPGREDLIGVLRTILGSIEVWGNISPTSRGYLRYIEGFMAQLGVHCQQLPADFDLATLEDEDDEDAVAELPEPEESELLVAGRAWLKESQLGARDVFCALADEMIATGDAEEVTDTCQQLMGEIGDNRALDELGFLFARAQQYLRLAAP
jgi:hypothetical protein